ncbi:MAG: hypothetical protein NTY29_05130, partial [Proteobacteria bacterium]|nr:hypothetical protein [Pseudomonadota bacterium]
MKKDSSIILRILFVVCLFQMIAGSFYAPASLAQCPPQDYPDYTVDCGNGGCCTPAFPVCCSDAMLNAWCCQQGTVCCYDQLGYPGCCPSEQTTTIPSATTSTVPGGLTTTTTQGGGGPDTYLAAINITGAG